MTVSNQSKPNSILIDWARIAISRTYSPYSEYSVGVALMAMQPENPEAKVFLGTNIENISYGLTICAERAAIFAAISQGYTAMIELVCMTHDGGSSCGACRQVMLEFSKDMSIFFIQEDGYVVLKTTQIELLPAPFILKE